MPRTQELVVQPGTKVPPKLRGKPFAKGPDARRGVSPGRPTDDFTAKMRSLTSAEATIRELAKILKDGSHEHFIKALTFCADRGYGKPVQPVDVTSNGESIADVLKRAREREKRMREEIRRDEDLRNEQRPDGVQ
jgi:hypothetical protein